MKLNDIVKQNNELYQKLLQDPSQKQLVDGSMPIETFKEFFIQSQLYMDAYKTFLYSVLSHRGITGQPDLSFLNQLAVSLDKNGNIFNHFVKIGNELGIDCNKICCHNSNPATSAMHDFLWYVASTGGLGDKLALLGVLGHVQNEFIKQAQAKQQSNPVIAEFFKIFHEQQQFQVKDKVTQIYDSMEHTQRHGQRQVDLAKKVLNLKIMFHENAVNPKQWMWPSDEISGVSSAGMKQRGG